MGRNKSRGLQRTRGLRKTMIPSGIIPLAWEYDGGCIRCASHKPNADGYPTIKRNKKRAMTIARHILFKKYGEQPSQIVSRHTCDNRWCINPDHIISGTTQENTADRVARNRSARIPGEKSHKAKLTNEKVLEIRRLSEAGVSKLKIAAAFGVHEVTIYHIVYRETWRNI